MALYMSTSVYFDYFNMQMRTIRITKKYWLNTNIKNFGTGVLSGDREETMWVLQYNHTSKYTTDEPFPLDPNLASDLCVLPFHQTSITCISIRLNDELTTFARTIPRKNIYVTDNLFDIIPGIKYVLFCFLSLSFFSFVFLFYICTGN